MTKTDVLSELKERVDLLEGQLEELKRLVVRTYGKPSWKVHAEDVDFDAHYAKLLREANSDDSLEIRQGKPGADGSREQKRSEDRSAAQQRATPRHRLGA